MNIKIITTTLFYDITRKLKKNRINFFLSGKVEILIKSQRRQLIEALTTDGIGKNAV